MTPVICLTNQSSETAIPILALTQQELEAWLANQDERTRTWIKSNGFIALPDTICLIPGPNGSLQKVLLGVSDRKNFWHFGGLPLKLSAGTYYLSDENKWASKEQYRHALLGFGLGAYRFEQYRNPLSYPAKLLIADETDYQVTSDWLSVIYWIRDLINIPAEDLGPADLAQIAKNLADDFKASIQIISGDNLLTHGYRALHTVGRASLRPPCLIDFSWGDPANPSVTLVGKGICFDSGGLNIKDSAGMLLMKKDMAGAAHALGLAKLIMQRNLPIRLRVLLPAADNNVGSKSFRPGDVIKMKNDLRVEIINTDGEGRLVLADAISAIAADPPNYLIDFSTLTGAARAALGPDLPAFFCNEENLAATLLQKADETCDLFWRLPLYKPYELFLISEVADITNCSLVPMAGAITAALFLQRFIPKSTVWAHFDMFAWNLKAMPGKPVGGEVFALRAVFKFIQSLKK